MRSIRWHRGAVQLTAALALLLLLGSFAMLNANPRPDTVASVNGHEITKDTFYDMLETFAIDGVPFGRLVLEQLISEALLMQAAEADNYIVTENDIDAELDFIRQTYGQNYRLVLAEAGVTEARLRDEIRLTKILDHLGSKGIVITDEDVQQFYEENQDAFFMPELYMPDYIVVDSKEEADAIRGLIMSGADFATMRDEKSLDNTPWGGWTKEDGIPAQIADPVFALEVGEISQPVFFQGAYYIIKLDAIVPPHTQPLDEVAEDIRDYLLYTQMPSHDEIVDALWAAANVDVLWDNYKSLATSTAN